MGPPVDELRGTEREIHSVKVNVQGSLGKWPPRTRRASGTAGAAAGTPGRGERPKRSGKAAAAAAERAYRIPFE